MRKTFTSFCILVTILVMGIFLWLCIEEEEVGTEEESKVQAYYNAYITDVEGDLLHFFDGEYHEALLVHNEISANVSDNTIWDVSGGNEASIKKGIIADIYVVNGNIREIVIKSGTRISEKVVALTETEVELENRGVYPFAPDCVFYNLYGELKKTDRDAICVGYDFSDFILEDGEITVVLNVRKGPTDKLRILLTDNDFKTYYQNSVRLSCDTDYLVKYIKGEEPVEILHKAGEEITLAENGKFTGDYQGRITIVPVYREGKITVLSLNRAQGNPVYYGSMEAVSLDGGIGLINEVGLEEYLYHVVPSEMPASYPMEALKAQAVCARTYAYTHILKPGLPTYGAHMDDSTAYQVYGNTKEQQNTNIAVNETCGQILCDGGEILQTYYYSTSCGIGADERTFNPGSEDLDRHLMPQRIGENCSEMPEVFEEEATFREFISKVNEEDFEKEEPWYRWNTTLDLGNGELLLTRLKERYRYNPDHILKKKGDTYILGEVDKLGKVRNIEVIKRGVGGIAEEILIEGDEESYKVISQSDIRYVLCDGNTKVIRQDNSDYICKTLLPSAFFIIDRTESQNGSVFFTLTRGGFGHGAGMSQNAAKNMAERGCTVEEILAFFYKNSEIKKAGLP